GEDLGAHASKDDVGDLLRARPQVDEVDRIAVGTDAERLGGQIEVDAAGEREGHYQGRGGEVARARQRVDAALEVPIAGEHRDTHQIARFNGCGDGLGAW